MNGRLGMHCDPNLGWGDVKEPAGFDNLQSFVEHGSRVDGDAAPHDPGRMLQGLFGGDVLELIKGCLAEGTTGGREPDGFHFIVSAYAHALVDGVMFAIDGKDGDLALTGGGGQDFAGGYHAFLVGETDGLTGEDGG